MTGIREHIRSRLTTSQPGLEIGASYSPIASKRDGYNVRVVDHASASDLRDKYFAQGVDIGRIEEVDAIDDGSEFTVLLESDADGFDYIIASHVFEHLPNPIAFLQRCGRALSANGALYLILPDRRHTFDYLRPPSTLGQMLDAFIEKRQRHTVGSLLDHRTLTVRRGEAFSWLHDEPQPLSFIGGIDSAAVEELRADTSGEYVDCHAWIFTASSARLLMSDLNAAGLSPLRETEFRQDSPNEFLLVLSKSETVNVRMDRLTLAEAALAEAASPMVAPASLVQSRPVYATPVRSTTPVPLPVGMMSPNGNIMLGQEGQLFLVEGSNGVLSQYDRTNAEAAPDVARWRSLVAARAEHAESSGAQFFQTIVPEKLTVVPHLFPRPLRTPTALFSEVEATLTGLLGPRYISTLEPLRALGASGLRQGDSHLSAEGSAAVVRAMLSAMAPGTNIDTEFTQTGKLQGDMFIQLFGFEVPEIFPSPPDNVFPVPRQVKTVAALREKHEGYEEHWENPGAVIDRTVLVFGNSFFAYEHLGPAHLSWWFARLFRRFHFMWTPRYLPDMVTDLQPDIVLCQAIERFLPTVPRDAVATRRAATAAE